MPQISSMSTAEYFWNLARNELPKAGIRDIGITAYTAGVLDSFVDAGAFRRAARQAPRYVSDMITGVDTSLWTFQEAQAARYAGDFSLFMLGIFPENLERRRIPQDFYAASGKRLYKSASSYYSRRGHPVGSVLSDMAYYFENCVGGLNRIRENHFHIEKIDYDMLIVPKDRKALQVLMVDAMQRWRESRNPEDKRTALYYAEKLGMSEKELFNG